MKKITAMLLVILSALSLFCGCKKEEAPADTYTGVLSKVRLGMPMKKIVALNSGTELYYDSDTEIWCVSTDTDLMEIKDRIPADSQFFYADDSLITYTFKYSESDGDNYLTAYMEEIPCKLDRKTAEEYYKYKKAALISKYAPAEEAVVSTVTGTEGVDLTLDHVTVMTLSSFEVTLTMQLTYDTVDGVEDYFGTYYSVKVKELANKTAVEVTDEKK
ncbi:MAG: hypothetical protein ACI4J0_10830 [Huintestinicola sp.]|uniref:hypothetical protein n=1 Tax=Huintestinicola sp. TaxID=2981661 RepID=UPI003F089C2E